MEQATFDVAHAGESAGRSDPFTDPGAPDATQPSTNAPDSPVATEPVQAHPTDTPPQYVADGEEAPPLYTAEGQADLGELVDVLLVANADQLNLPLTRVEPNPSAATVTVDGDTRTRDYYQTRAIDLFYQLVRAGDRSGVELFVQRGIVSPDVLSATDPESECGERFLLNDDEYVGTTPLLVATQLGDAAMVRQLLHLGADLNLLARPPGYSDEGIPGYLRLPATRRHMTLRRTPLMFAAQIGNVAMVTLFYKELHADDTIVAPDGQIALRLAADGGHRDIVKLLPACRAGTWARLKLRNAKAARKVKKACKKIGSFVYNTVTIVFWHIPKFVVWTLPEYLVVIPLYHGIKYLVQHPKDICLAVWRFFKKLPSQIWSAMKWTARNSIGLVKGIGELALLFIDHMVDWIWDGLVKVGNALGNAVMRLVAVLHTAVMAVIDFFRSITLKDVWNGIVIAFKATFVELPQAAWRGLKSFPKYLMDGLEDVFGFFGDVAYMLITLPVVFVLYVPKQLGRMVVALGGLVGSGFHELIVLVNPKYGV